MAKANLQLVNAEAEKIKQRFGALFSKVNKNEPREADVESLREMLRDHQELELWRKYLGVMSTAESYVLQCSPVGKALPEVWRERLADLRKELGYADAPGMEKLLISHASLCWLRLGLIEIQHQQFTSGSHTLTAGVYWDRRLSAAQKRFTRACVALARVRCLSRPKVQINVATVGGQQVNVAG